MHSWREVLDDTNGDGIADASSTKLRQRVCRRVYLVKEQYRSMESMFPEWKERKIFGLLYRL